jgi:hypothetical protein
MSKINIKPVKMGLSLGEATSISISVNYTLTTTDVTLQCHVYNAHGAVLNVSPIHLDVPPDVLATWGMDFSPVIEWVFEKLNLTKS